MASPITTAAVIDSRRCYGDVCRTTDENFMFLDSLECQEEFQTDENDSVFVFHPPSDGRLSTLACGFMRAKRDPVISNGDRVLRNLLMVEDRFQYNSTSYFFFQDDIKPYMRKMVSSWMLDVFSEQKRDESVFCLSISLLDKFLSSVKVKKTQLQLVAAVCMFIASKVKEVVPFEAQELVAYTDRSISIEDLLAWEMMVVEALDWDVCLTTAHDFLDLILVQLPIDQSHHQIIMHHAETFLCLCSTEHGFLIYPPSVLASACLLSSICGLRFPMTSTLAEVGRSIQKITSIDIDCLKACQEQIEQLLKHHSESELAADSSHLTNHKLGAPQSVGSSTTPTDVTQIVLD